MAEARSIPSAEELAAGVRAGSRRALSRALSAAEVDDERAADLLGLLHPHSGLAATVGITGPPGAGKSTLVGALVGVRRAEARDVGVLAVDPSSPYNGGAVLGDRLRLSDHFEDRGVFIRSLASRGALGGLSNATGRAMVVLDAFGFPEILVETVGVGQSEVDVVRHTDTVVLVLIPGSGDSIQAIKAGIMEIPDIVCVNKAEHPDSDGMVRDLRTALAGAGERGWRVPVLATEASSGRGVEALAEALDQHARHLRENDGLGPRREAASAALVEGIALARLRRQVGHQMRSGPVREALRDVARRRADPATVAERVIRSAGSAVEA
ncbi:MAG: methylmalonyl Co-A mutase-associated GTPase MeaB [Nocardioides sp.]